MSREITTQEIGKSFNKQWNLDKEKVDGLEKEFMETMRSILWHLSKGEEEESNLTEAMSNSYDSTMILGDIIKAIRDFNKVYHIVSITSGWDKEEEPSQ